jgi:hypothetical protein
MGKIKELTGLEAYLHFDDKTCYPHPSVVNELQWICRYGNEKDIIELRMYIASILDAYWYLTNGQNITFAKKKLTEIRRRILADSASSSQQFNGGE